MANYNYNRVILMGNLTRDPELRYTPSGQAVADIRLAINRRTRTPSGERRESTVFVDVTAWGRQAEVINEYLSKGQPVFLEGRLALDEWTSQDGQRRSKLRVVLERFQFITPRTEPRAAAPLAEAPPPQPSEPASPQAPPPSENDTFNDVPF